MWVGVIYFVYLAVLGVARSRPLPALLALLVATMILVVGMPHILPVFYLLVGYWLPALLVRRPQTALERRLQAFDAALFGSQGLTEFVQRSPWLLVECLELAYLFCYAVVPLGFAWLVAAGFGHQANSFWSTVLLASFICYGLLPWLPSRAPRAIEACPPVERRLVRKLNLFVLGRASVQWNTFPSGHTAASVATALAVGARDPLAGWVFGVLAVSIAVGSVVGRYHYAADALAGALVAVAAFLTASAAPAL